MRRFRQKQRILCLAVFFAFLLALLFFRLGYLQLFKGAKLAEEAVRQRSQSVILHYNRGDILDRNGLSLLGGKQEKVLAVFPELLDKNDNKEGLLEMLSAFLPQPVFSRTPFIALRGVEPPEEDVFKNIKLSGMVLTEAQKRYSEEALATHIIGHIGPTDGEGKVGLELVFNEELRGASPTLLTAIIDGKKKLVAGLGYRLWEKKDAHRPLNLVLTIDYHIQKKVEEIMDKWISKGAVVVMEPNSGDILAMASRPNYFQSKLPLYLGQKEEYSELLNSQPFINRSILSYPPGSVFKIVVAAAALETKEAWLSKKYYCPGYIKVGGKIINCLHGPHKELTLAQAFAHSCNSVFIEMALNLGPEVIYKYATAFGLGKETGIPLGGAREGGEAKGLIPLPEEMELPGDLALAAIGQGKVEATPLQIARLTCIIANGGYLVEPRLVKSLQTRQGLTLKNFKTGRREKILNPVTVSKLRYMMLGVVEYGTGEAAASSLVVLGGKTGTAETERFLNGEQQSYSWFTGCVPLEGSSAVITVFVEKPRQGNAACVFKQIAEEIYPFLQ